MASQRDQENKNREDFHTQSYPTDPLSISGTSLKKAEEAARNLKSKDDSYPDVNHDVTYISDDVFQKELEHLPMTPQSNIILLLGPKIKAEISKTGLMLDERSAKESQAEKLNKIPSGFRIVAISKALPKEQTPLYKEGDYIFTMPKANHTILMNFQPLSEDLDYYEVKTIDIRYAMTQETVEKFIAKENEAKGGE